MPGFLSDPLGATKYSLTGYSLTGFSTARVVNVIDVKTNVKTQNEMIERRFRNDNRRLVNRRFIVAPFQIEVMKAKEGFAKIRWQEGKYLVGGLADQHKEATGFNLHLNV